MASDIVCEANVQRYYGQRPEVLARYQEIVQSGRCPFCTPNIENEFVVETPCWKIVVNQFPYKNARLHLLVLPERHIVSLLELEDYEWEDMPNALRRATDPYPFLADGYGLAVRTGEIGGVTLHHLHWHLIVPEVGESGQIEVNFGIG